jgi:hypothetical protein
MGAADDKQTEMHIEKLTQNSLQKEMEKVKKPIEHTSK